MTTLWSPHNCQGAFLGVHLERRMDSGWRGKRSLAQSSDITATSFPGASGRGPPRAALIQTPRKVRDQPGGRTPWEQRGRCVLGVVIPAAVTLGRIKVILLQRCLSPFSRKGNVGEGMVRVQRSHEDKTGEGTEAINVHIHKSRAWH